MMKIWSLIKDRVLALCSPRRAQICSKITHHLIICAFLFKSVADICHFLSFDLFRIKPLELNYEEYHNDMYFVTTFYILFQLCVTNIKMK